MPIIGAGRNISPRIQVLLDEACSGGGGTGGPMAEDFDASLLLPAGWTSSGDAVWFIQNVIFNSYPNAAESGTIDSSQQTSLFFSRDGLTALNTISFDYRTDSENADKLKFFINGVLQGEWSGPYNSNFISVSFTTDEGMNDFEWRFVRDWNWEPLASDRVWIDNVVIT